MLEICKESGVNFVLMCTHTVDMAMKTLSKEKCITHPGKYMDGGYYKLSVEDRELVDKKAEEICITARLLSLSSNKKFSGSK